MYKKVVSTLIVLAMLTSLFTGCSSDTDTKAPSAPEVDASKDVSAAGDEGSNSKGDADNSSPNQRDTLIWNLAVEPRSLDPDLSTDSAGGQILNNIFEGLMASTDVLVNGCAESYDISDDGLEYTFHLRDNLKWSDGEALAASDFEYGWKRACNPQEPSPYAFIMSPYIKGANEYMSGQGAAEDMAVRAVDNNTLSVTLNYPVPYFLNLTSLSVYFPVRKDIVEKYGDGWDKSPETCISNGPFHLTEYQVGSHLMLSKNENYWDADNVNVPNIKALLIAEAVTALSGYEAGEIDVLGSVSMPSDDVPRLIAEDPYMSVVPGLGTYYIDFNVDKAPTNDVRVRKALSLSVDRYKLCQQVLKGGEMPATGIVPPSLSFSDGTCFRKLDADGNVTVEYGIDPGKADVEQAKSLLSEAGYPDGEGFPALTYIYSTDDTNKKIAEALQEMFKSNLNITIKLENVESAVLPEIRSKGEYELAKGGWYGDYPDPMTMLDLFTSYSGNNYPQWRWNEQPNVAPWDTTLNPENQAFDEAIKKAQATTGKERDAALSEAEGVMMDNMVIMPLYYYVYKSLINGSVVENLKFDAMGRAAFKPAYFVE